MLVKVRNDLKFDSKSARMLTAAEDPALEKGFGFMCVNRTEEEAGVKMAANCELLFKKEAAGQSILMLSVVEDKLLPLAGRRSDRPGSSTRQ